MTRSDFSKDGHAHGYVIHFEGGVETSITCCCCGVTSNHPKDVAHRYCVRCHVFHDIFLGHTNAVMDLMKQLLREPKL